jgi:hypothetical protein
MTVKLHRCGNTWLKLGGHGCWQVQKELDAAGVDYVVIRSSRDELQNLSGQRQYPVLEYADGTVYRAVPEKMAAEIRAGRVPPHHVGRDVHDLAHEAHGTTTESM